MAIVWLTEKEASAQFKIAVGTLRDWRHKEVHIPFSKIGTLVRYDEAEVDAYIKAREVKVTS